MIERTRDWRKIHVFITLLSTGFICYLPLNLTYAQETESKVWLSDVDLSPSITSIYVLSKLSFRINNDNDFPVNVLICIIVPPIIEVTPDKELNIIIPRRTHVYTPFSVWVPGRERVECHLNATTSGNFPILVEVYLNQTKVDFKTVMLSVRQAYKLTFHLVDPHNHSISYKSLFVENEKGVFLKMFEKESGTYTITVPAGIYKVWKESPEGERILSKYFFGKEISEGKELLISVKLQKNTEITHVYRYVTRTILVYIFVGTAAIISLLFLSEKIHKRRRRRELEVEEIRELERDVLSVAKKYGGILAKSVVVDELGISLRKAEEVLDRFCEYKEAVKKRTDSIIIYDFPSARVYLSRTDTKILETLLDHPPSMSRVALLQATSFSLETLEESIKRLESRGIIYYDNINDEYKLRGIST